MIPASPAAALTGGVGLLERATGYTLGSLLAVTPQALGDPTPCREWDLRALLWHLDESLLALHEAGAVHHVGLHPVEDVGDPAADPVVTLRDRACRMLGAWTSRSSSSPVSIADHLLPTEVVAAAGAVEIAVHGWDVAAACGRHRPIPPALAEELLDLCPLLVSGLDRPTRFAAPVDLPSGASPGDRLVTFLGRRPAFLPTGPDRHQQA